MPEESFILASYYRREALSPRSISRDQVCFHFLSKLRLSLPIPGQTLRRFLHFSDSPLSLSVIARKLPSAFRKERVCTFPLDVRPRVSRNSFAPSFRFSSLSLAIIFHFREQDYSTLLISFLSRDSRARAFIDTRASGRGNHRDNRELPERRVSRVELRT